MEIELSEDLQHYKESLVLGLTAKQFLFSALALGVGTGIVLLLYEKIGITLSCYVATPFVVPLALTGFYNYHGLTFWQFAGKIGCVGCSGSGSYDQACGNCGGNCF